MSTFLQFYQQIEGHLLRASKQIDDYQSHIQRLQQTNEQLKAQLENTEKELQECKQKNLITTQTYREEDAAEIKKEINELVREINNCISYIKAK